MITRIPQPQFVGPMPAEVISQAGANGQRIAQMYASSIEEAYKNHIAQKQVEVEQQKAQAQAGYNTEIANSRKSNEQAARDKAISEEFLKGWDNTDPGSHWQYLLDNKQMAMKYYTSLSGGDKELAGKFYESNMGTAMKIASDLSLARGGALSVSQPPQGAQSPQGVQPLQAAGQTTPSTSPAPPAGPPATSPLAPFAPQQAPSQAPAPMVQGANPQGSPTAAGGSDAMSSLASSFASSLPSSGAGQAASETFTRIKGYIAGSTDASNKITPKGLAAVNTVLKPVVTVLKDAEITKELKLYGMTDDELARRAQELQDAMTQNPDLDKFVRGTTVLGAKEMAEFNNSISADAKQAKILETALHDRNMEDLGNARLGAVTLFDEQRLRYMQSSLAAKVKTSTDTKDIAEKKLQIDAIGKGLGALTDYDNAVNAFRNTLRDKNGALDEIHFQEEYNKAITDQYSPLAVAQRTAANLYGAALNLTPEKATVRLKGRSFLGIQLGPDTTGSATTFPSEQPGQKQSGIGPIPLKPGAPVNPNAGNTPAPSSLPSKMTPQQLLKESKRRAQAGQ